MDSHIESVLWTHDEIATKVLELASIISVDLAEAHQPPVVVGVATDAFLFLADLVRHFKFPMSVDFIRVESYNCGTVSSGIPKISSDLKLDVVDKHAIPVEDIVYTRNTLSCLVTHMESKGASSVSVSLSLTTRRDERFKYN